jgi:hypothetical protein
VKRASAFCLVPLLACVCDQRTPAQAPRLSGGSGLPVTTASAADSNSGLPALSVLEFGAKGDGVTDDTAAINAATSACTGRAVPHNGCVLYFPSGVYRTTGLSVRSFVHIKGDGWGTSVIQLAPNTEADVLTIPLDAFNFSIYGITLDGNARNRGKGNCLATATTSLGPAEWNTANKQTAPINAQKWGHIEEVMFSNCSADGIHITAFNYMLFFDNFYAYGNGVYGLYTQGTNSSFTNFQIERNGTAGIHVANSNNRFTSGEVIWNGEKDDSEAAVYVTGSRNVFTAVESEDNYTSGFFDRGTDNIFAACVSDTNGYAKRNTRKSSRTASGFVIGGWGGIYVGDKVTSYRGRLSDGNFATEWPYTIQNPSQAKIDISYDSTNRLPPTSWEVPQIETPAPGHAACIKSAGPPVVLGFCSTAVGSSGACTCN